MAFLARHRWPSLLLLAVCVLHGLSSLVLVGIHHGFGWDETVYLSQINRVVPAGIWSAPRSRGLTLLVAPVTLVTPSVAATRLWLALLTSALMYVGFRPWLRLVTPYAVPVAALFFSAIWTTIFYGEEAMPNLFVACFAVPAVALTLLFLREPAKWWRLVVVGFCVAMVALLRPSDGAYLAAPLVLMALVSRAIAWRPRLIAAGGLAAGLLAGAAEWVIEAYVSFGGPVHRYHLAVDEQGGDGLHFTLVAHAKTLAGPILCRGGCDPHPAVWAMLWWFALPALVVTAFVVARRAERVALGFATAGGLAMAAQYVFSVGYSAPRFLTPAYALLAIPVGVAFVAGAERAPAGVVRWSVLGLAGVLLLAQAASQIWILRHDVLPGNNRGLAVWQAEASALRHHVVGDGPCAVAGPSTPPIAYGARCRSVVSVRTGDFSPDTLRVYLSRKPATDAWLQSWTEIRLKLAGHNGSAYAYLPPGQTPR